jgi:hypothetical protein
MNNDPMLVKKELHHSLRYAKDSRRFSCIIARKFSPVLKFEPCFLRLHPRSPTTRYAFLIPIKEKRWIEKLPRCPEMQLDKQVGLGNLAAGRGYEPSMRTSALRFAAESCV